MCVTANFDFSLNIFPFNLNHWFFFQGIVIKRAHVFLTKWQPVLSKNPGSSLDGIPALMFLEIK